MQTIEYRTQVVSSFVDQDTANNFVVRRLSDRKSHNRQLFIVTINSDANEGEVIPFAEIATSSSNKLRYIVKPSDQYPSLAVSRLTNKIEAVISKYMKDQWNEYIH
ncbi:hypothetical protein FXN80_10925 [Dickeya fangzhongdai]|uniref:hypothetical protein n=1 Tax=Dickeya fangzhongdai TaxID=1778540 RepID=UPI001F2589AB|nr:hypothetical protein [Dickeya fangzhongdai]UMB78874.1 hypothetical protein FXN80_10925 [Dickeya fangzhongdai]